MFKPMKAKNQLPKEEQSLKLRLLQRELLDRMQNVEQRFRHKSRPEEHKNLLLKEKLLLRLNLKKRDSKKNN